MVNNVKSFGNEKEIIQHHINATNIEIGRFWIRSGKAMMLRGNEEKS